jgi:exopolysaccharide/PEP-CTERM locus tyrosine autokinase
MGKISNALERYKKEKFVDAKRLPIGRPKSSDKNGPDSSLASELSIQNGFNSKLVTYSAPDSIDAEYFKVLRAQILFPKKGERSRTIMITSALPGEGKTFVASNLAVSIALGVNENVLLIDCDFRRPSLHNMFGYSNSEGLHEYLIGKRRLNDLLIRSKIQKLSLLTAGSESSKPSELLSSTVMKEFLEWVKGRNQNRYIIIDSPPCQVTSETGVLGNYVDGIIFVVMAQRSPREMIQRNIEYLGKEKILGIVFNGYSHGDKFYHKYYKKYYGTDY